LNGLLHFELQPGEHTLQQGCLRAQFDSIGCLLCGHPTRMPGTPVPLRALLQEALWRYV